MIDRLRCWLRDRPMWVKFQAVNREGWGNAWRRWQVTPRVLASPPVRTRSPDTSTAAPAEVHVLLWERDYLNGLWATKTFYAASGVDWPLYWHQGGPLSSRAVARLRKHFPDSRWIKAADADREVDAELGHRGLANCRTGRSKAFMLRKLIDPYLYGRADYLLLLDTDVLFFARPVELLDAVAERAGVSLYNRDRGYWYNLTPDAARDRYGIDLVPEINAGLGLVRRAGVDLPLLDRFLTDPDAFADPWLTEQTVQALLASKYGVRHLPDTYGLSTDRGLSTPDGSPLVCKHYPGHPRVHLYQEGMPHVLRSKLLENLRCRRCPG